ncbi:hypothetical protein [Nocardia paucivorans]|uniref:hypothetical protein n=1 Tax=Nocardia paucivorans TaxID=114259 RepID=UPI00059334F8|nr:hypothetical protein [Nocardia paucivorans]
MTFLVTLVALAVFTTFAYYYLRESRIPELIERYRPREPIEAAAESYYDEIRRYRDLSAAKRYAESRRYDTSAAPAVEEPSQQAS